MTISFRNVYERNRQLKLAIRGNRKIGKSFNKSGNLVCLICYSYFREVRKTPSAGNISKHMIRELSSAASEGVLNIGNKM